MKKLLWPGRATALLLVVASAGGLVWTFSGGHEDTPWAYFFYALSAYTLMIWCAQIPGLFRWGKQRMEGHAMSARWLHDLSFRAGTSLRASLVVNGLFGCFKLAIGTYLRSWWEVTFGAYYIVLALARFLLLRDWSPGSDLVLEWRNRRRCGGLLLALDVPLVGVAVLVVMDGYGKNYPGYLIYAAAFYTFYCVISGIVAQIRSRKYKSPAVSAAKSLSFANALVSLLSLQTAMFAAFGGDAAFQNRMNAYTGAGVCAAIALLGLWMLRKEPISQ